MRAAAAVEILAAQESQFTAMASMSCSRTSASRIPSSALLLLLLLLSSCCCCCNGSTNFLGEKITTKAATVEIGTRTTIGRVSDNFLCATLDWWPAEKCDYGTCSWRHASLHNLDLEHPMLQQAVKALSPLTVRLGGTLQDKLMYRVGHLSRPCIDFVKKPGAMFGFSQGCLNMSRWIELNKFFQKTGTQIAFGLNALYGRETMPKGVTIGAWDPSNAHDFIQFTVDNKFEMLAWELGNELTGNGVGTSIGARQYAADSTALRKVVDEIYAGSKLSKPLVVAPDGFFTQSWYQTLLQKTGPGVLNAITRHIYNLGAGVDQHLIQKILSPAYLSQEAGAFKLMRDTLSKYGPWAQAWIGEAGGAYNSGKHLVSDAFVNSFWYLDQLGMAAAHNTAVYCRQSLVGGNYALLQTDTFHPNPDYYSALLWNQIMGRDVLPATVVNETYLRAYAHCSKTNPGGLSVLLINLSNSTFYTVSLDLTVTSGESAEEETETQRKSPRLEYHLSAPGSNLQSQSVLLNGELLEVTRGGEIPRIQPLSAVDPSMPIRIAPLTIAFAELPQAAAPACIIT